MELNPLQENMWHHHKTLLWESRVPWHDIFAMLMYVVKFMQGVFIQNSDGKSLWISMKGELNWI